MNPAISLYKNSNTPYHYCLILLPFRIFYNIHGDTKSPKIIKYSGNNEIPEYIIAILKKFHQANHHYIIEYQLMNPLKKGFYFDKGAKFIDVLLAEIPIQKGLVAAELMDNSDFFKNQKEMHGKSIRILLDNNLIPDTATPIHELFHVFQYNYCNFNNMWFMEGLARWSQNITHERVNIRETLPSTTDELNYLISRAHDAEYFWRELISKCGNTIDFVKILLEQSALQAVELEKRMNLVHWSKEDKKSSLNNEYIFKAIVKTIEILQVQPDSELLAFISTIQGHKKMIKVGTINLSNLSENELKEFENIEEIDGDLIIESTNIHSLNSFNRLKKVNTVKITDNPNLIEILGFNALESIQNLEISHNINLEKIYGFFKFFASVSKINGYIKIEQNKKLDSLLFLRGLSHVGSSFYLHHNNIGSLKGLEDLEEVGASFSISSNNISGLLPLQNLRRVNGMLGVAYNQLTSLDGLENLKEVSVTKWGNEYRSIAIQGNKNLKDISSLQNIVSNTNHCIINLDSQNKDFITPIKNSNFYNQSLELISNGENINVNTIFQNYEAFKKTKILFHDVWNSALKKHSWFNPYHINFKNLVDVEKIIKINGIKYAYGQNYRAQKFLFYNKKELKKIGLQFIVNEIKTISLLLNKENFYNFMEKNHFEKFMPKVYKSINEIEYPCILKPIMDGNADSAVIFYSPDNIEIKDNYFINEYIISNVEYATNIFFRDNILYEITYKKTYKNQMYILNENTKYQMIDEKIECPFKEEFTSILKKICKKGEYLSCCIDYKIKDNLPKIFEINVRFGYTLARYEDDFKSMMAIYIMECHSE